MKNENLKHDDCSNFSSIDAAKGLCRRTNRFVFIDTPVCENFSEADKCRNCAFFKNVNKDNIGICTGFKKEAWTFAELKSVTCECYKSNKNKL